LLSWLTVVVTYRLSRRVGFGASLAFSTSLLLLIGSPWLAYARSLYSEPIIGLTVVLALWCIEAERPVLAAICLAAAAWLKPPFAVVAIGVILERIWTRRWKDVFILSVIVGVLGVALMLFNHHYAHTFVISGNVSWTPAENFYFLYETLLHPEHGLFIFVPWVLFAFAAAKRGLLENSQDSTLLRRIAVPGFLYFILIAATPVGPGFAYGPRYWVPLLPWMAIAAVEFARSAKMPARIAFIALVLLSAAYAIPGALRYPQMFSQPPTAAWKRL
jgi:hypothetical protein